MASLCVDSRTNLMQYIARVQKFPMLSQEEEVQLAKNWNQYKDISSAHKLITSHLNLVVKIAMKFKNYGLLLMDLVMEGNMGLMHAVKKFNPDLGFRFSTYAVWWIEASIKDFILKSWSFVKIGTTQAQRRLFFSLRKIKKRILQYTNRETLNNEEIKAISNELSVSEGDVLQMNYRMACKDQSLNDCIKIGDDSKRELQDMIPCNLVSQEVTYQNHEEKELKEEILNNALASLNERARDIFISRYLSENIQTLDELSAFASVSDVQLKEKYKDWLVYTALEDGEKVCYIVSYPKKKSEYYTTNRKPYVMVSYVDKKADEVSVTSGFQYDKEPVALNIDKKIKYTLPIIQGSFAWAEHTKIDQDLILKMKQGLSMVVNGKAKTVTIDDTYSLLGFQKAYQKMHDLCHTK
ncbi:RNA polymerase sigma factor RpoH [Trichonephila clavata]|uniref:RNA polymerase sigma factor RpoH n=1 Tax=Trichonephila clavata TaxID=2740835 RepID=A0A8X6HXP4_TRICU|nr:RNA polymerase sigma factor RpoH [Trichonephila clavata]